MEGVISAGDEWSAQAGANIFKKGGNAVDAAVAAAFAAFVCETWVVNIGGGGYALVLDGRPSEHRYTAKAYDFFCAVPSGQNAGKDFREIVIDFGGDKQSFNIGRASTAVPGVVAGLCTMGRERGRLPLATLLQPAIDLALNGFVLRPNMDYILKLLAPIYLDTPELAAVTAPNGRLMETGNRVFMPELARTLEALAQEGPDLFYRGAIARAIVDDQQQNGGLLTAKDLAGYEVREEEPITINYRGFKVLLTPPSSHGGVLIAFSLKLLETLSLDHLEPNGFEHLFRLAHVLDVTNKARKDWHADRSPARQKVAHFLSETHIEKYARQLQEALEGKGDRLEPSLPKPPANTTHISTMDEEGLAVSTTLSAGEAAGYLVADTGICLNNMLGEFDLNPHGFHQDPPGTRLMSMMSPVIVLKNNKPVLAVGSAGSNRLRSAIIQTIVNCLDFTLSPDDAINRGRIHYEDGLLQVEGGIDPRVSQQLGAAGFKVNHWTKKNLFFGGAQLVANFYGHLEGGADKRRGGMVA